MTHGAMQTRAHNSTPPGARIFFVGQTFVRDKRKYLIRNPAETKLTFKLVTYEIFVNENWKINGTPKLPFLKHVSVTGYKGPQQVKCASVNWLLLPRGSVRRLWCVVASMKFILTSVVRWIHV